ncbi:MAG: SDR family oxidoreductase [Thermoproteota archaeon]
MAMKNFHNKNCLIIGASGGIGSQIAKKMVELNCNVFLVGKNKNKLCGLKKELKKKNKFVKIETGHVDLANDLSINKIIKEIRKKFVTVDILINTAGLFIVKPLQDSSIKEFDECFKINVRAPFIFCKEFSGDMKKKKWGRIVNIGSSSAYNGFKNSTIYCATKHSLLGLSRALFVELKGNGIRTYCISPGSTQTKMGKLTKDQNFETFLNPSEVAEYVAFVISFDRELISEELRLNRVKME